MSVRIALCLVTLLLCRGVSSAQSFRVYGKVVESQDYTPLPYASIMLEGTAIGVVANDSGHFRLAIPPDHQNGVIVVSYLGYSPQRMALTELGNRPVVALRSEEVSVPEVSVVAYAHIQSLPERILAAIPTNYPQLPILLTGFYRNRLTLHATAEDYLYAEAVLQMYKAPYDYSLDEDQVKLIKGRRKTERYTVASFDGHYRAELPFLVSGPQAGSKLDVVAQRPPFFNQLSLAEYTYSVVGETHHENRPVYILDYAPRDSAASIAHSTGRLYVDQQTLALVRADFETHPRRIEADNRTDSELQTLRQVQTVQYRLYGNLWYLHYVSAETQYRSRTTQQRLTLSLEFVVTDIETEQVAPFRRKEILAESDVLSEYVGEDPDSFWDTYNVIH